MTALPTVRQILADLSGKTDFPDDIKLGHGPCGRGRDTLELDSLDKVEAVMRLEEAFGIEISDDDADRSEMSTPVGIAAYIDRRLAADTPDEMGFTGPAAPRMR